MMRQQLANMKDKLHSQLIVNESLMRKVMKGKASWMNTFVKAEVIALPLVYIVIAMICSFYDISQWYALSFLILAAIDTFMDRYTVRIPATLFGKLSMIDLRKFLMKQKRLRFIQAVVMFPVTVIWMVGLCWAMASGSSMLTDGVSDNIVDAAKTGGIIGGIVGGIVGVVVTLILYRKMQRTNDSLLQDIGELEKEA